jgi:phage terminase small subunit
VGPEIAQKGAPKVQRRPEANRRVPVNLKPPQVSIGGVVGKRGPRPEPTAIRLLRGNPSKRGINAAEPKPSAATSLEPPPFLDPLATEIWRELAPKAHSLGVLTEFDLTRFAMLCAHLARWRRHYTADPDGADLVRTGLMRRESEIVARLAACFGLDPSSRTALKIAPSEADDPLTAFLRRRPGARA